MFSISEFQYAFQAHPALLQLLRKYPQIFTLNMYTVLNKQMFNKWNRSVKKSTEKLWAPWKNNAIRNDVLKERSHMWTLKNTDVEWFLSKHSVWHIRIFPFFHLMDSTFVKVNQVLLVRAEKKLTLTYHFPAPIFFFFVVAYAFWRYAITLFFFFRSELYFIHLKFELSNKMR